MKKIDLVVLDSEVQRLYQKINDLVSFHSLELVNLAYPALDGVIDSSAVGQMLLLRDSLRSLQRACTYLDKRLSIVAED